MNMPLRARELILNNIEKYSIVLEIMLSYLEML
jgi:hypothetical protein